MTGHAKKCIHSHIMSSSLFLSRYSSKTTEAALLLRDWHSRCAPGLGSGLGMTQVEHLQMQCKGDSILSRNQWLPELGELQVRCWHSRWYWPTDLPWGSSVLTTPGESLPNPTVERSKCIRLCTSRRIWLTTTVAYVLLNRTDYIDLWSLDSVTQFRLHGRTKMAGWHRHHSSSYCAFKLMSHATQ